PLVLNRLLSGLIMGTVMLPSLVVFGIAMAVTAAAGGRGGPPVLIIVAGFFSLLNLLVLIYIGIRIGYFAVPLILDRRCGPVEALQGSWALSRGHFWGLLGVGILLGLIQAAGFMMCFIGALFTTPLYCLTMTAGYMLVAGTKRPVKPGASWEYEEEFRRN